MPLQMQQLHNNIPFNTRKVFERDSVFITHEELGGFDPQALFNKISEDRFLEIRHSLAGINLKIGGVVGRLPLTPSLALDVFPKFPVGNLVRIVALSDISLRANNVEKFYDVVDSDGYLPELILRAFAKYLLQLSHEGSHRDYKIISRIGIPRPRIDFAKSVQKLWSKGNYSKAVVSVFDFTLDNPFNQIIKTACLSAYSLARSEPRLKKECEVFAETLRRLKYIEKFPSHRNALEAHKYLTRVPRFKQAHHKAANIGLEIIRRSAVLYEPTDSGLQMPSYLILLDEVFESYIRNILREACLGLAIKVKDGNSKSGQKNLFDDNSSFKVKPDFILSSNSIPLLVGDVKYKKKPLEEDRYQIISHALSYQSKKAVLVYPAPAEGKKGLVRLGKIGDAIEVYEYYFDLAAQSHTEESNFTRALLELID